MTLRQAAAIEKRDMREQVQKLLQEAAERVVREIDPSQLERLKAVQVTSAKQAEHGDFASSAALALSGPLKLPARDLAERIRSAIQDPDGVLERTEIAGPGFINFFLAHAGWHDLLVRILRERERFGWAAPGSGERIQVEFVSANPTGPLTIGHGRNAVVGDTLARIYEAAGYDVQREYYFNDAGVQKPEVMWTDAGPPPPDYFEDAHAREYNRSGPQFNARRFAERVQGFLGEVTR